MGTATWRALAPADCPAWAGLLADAEQVDDLGEHYDADDLTEELADPALDAGRDTVGVWRDGELVAYGVVRGAPSAAGDRFLIRLEGAVTPKHRRQGIGTELLDWLRTRAAGIHAEQRPDLPAVIKAIGAVDNEGQRALVATAGFAPARWFFSMQRGLVDPPEVRVPDGLRMVPYAPRWSERTRLAHNEAFADHWSYTPRTAGDWEHWAVGQRAYRPETSFLLLDGEQLAGYLMTYEYEADTAVTGVREAYVGVLGTRRPWRGRGGGRALLAAAVRAYAAAGYQRAALDVDAGNPSGALGLYERVGFTVRRESVAYTRPLAG